jgi:hypothetical protein
LSFENIDNALSQTSKIPTLPPSPSHVLHNRSNFEKVVFEKDGALQARIKEILKRNILFGNLDEKQVQVGSRCFFAP